MIGFAALVTVVFFGCYLQKNSVADSDEPVGPAATALVEPNVSVEPGVSFSPSKPAADRYPNQVLWVDLPVRDYLGRYIDDIMEEIDATCDEYTEGGDENICAYREIGIIFCFDNRRKVYKIVTDPALCTYNGETLNVNRDKILEILGAPFMMGWTHWELEDVPEQYFIDYYDGKEGIAIYMPSPEEAATDIYID